MIENLKKKFVKVENATQESTLNRILNELGLKKVKRTDSKHLFVEGLIYIREGGETFGEARKDWHIQKQNIITFKTFLELCKEHIDYDVPSKVIFNEKLKRTTFVYPNFKVVRTDTKNNFDREIGVLVCLLKSLELSNYRSIIEYAYKNAFTTEEIKMFFKGIIFEKTKWSERKFNKILTITINDEVNINNNIIRRIEK